MIEKQPPGWSAHSELGEVQHQIGEIWSVSGDLKRAVSAYEEAVSLQRLVVESSPMQTEPRQRLVRHPKAVSVIHRQLGQLQLAVDAIAEVQQLAPADPDQVYWSAVQFAPCFAALDSQPIGDKDAMRTKLVELTVVALRHACDVGFDRIDDLNLAPEFDSIRDRPQFEECLASLSPRDLR